MRKYLTKTVSIAFGSGKMRLPILSPASRTRPPEKTPGVLWLHGGGYAVGMVHMSRADIYHTGMHAFDMLAPRRKISRQAAARFKQTVTEMLHIP